MGPRPNGRGKRQARSPPNNAQGVNGAAAKRPRKAERPRHDHGRRRHASMGPRPNGRGKNQTNALTVLERLRQWGRGQTAAERPAARSAPGPTGSASMGPRPNGRGKCVAAASISPGDFVRQWGRGQTAAERLRGMPARAGGRLRQWGRGQTAAESREGKEGAGRVRASMGPRPNGRGKWPPTTPSLMFRSVNGAAAKRPRKVDEH